MSRFIKRVQAIWMLGMALLRHVFVRPFVGSSDPAHWLAQIAQEGLFPAPQGSWEKVSKTSRCIGCGLCDSLLYTTCLAPSLTIQSAARLPGDTLSVLSQIEAVNGLATEIEKICPARVPIQEIVSLVRSRAQITS